MIFSSLLMSLLIAAAPFSARAFESIDAVKSIDCHDRTPVEDSDLYFTTQSRAAKKYTRKPGSIPYDYGNLNKAYGVNQTGVMTPTYRSNGSVLLSDPGVESFLELRPTSQAGVYEGLLTGYYDSVMAGWQPVRSHAMECTVRLF